MKVKLSNFFNKKWSTPGIEITNAEQTVIDRNGDGLADLVIHGGSFGSIGAGNYRDRTEVWAWDGENITLAEVFWPKSEFRIHVLFDADYAFALEDYRTGRIKQIHQGNGGQRPLYCRWASPL